MSEPLEIPEDFQERQEQAARMFWAWVREGEDPVLAMWTVVANYGAPTARAVTRGGRHLYRPELGGQQLLHRQALLKAWRGCIRHIRPVIPGPRP